MLGSRTIVVLLMTFVLTAGCSLRGTTQKAQATPTVPKPAVKPVQPPPQEPLSIPQTQVKLPTAQPVSDAALATVQEVAPVELPEPPNPKPIRRVTSATPPPGPKPEAPPISAGPAAPPATAPPAAAEPERPRIQELVSPAEQKQLTDSLEARKREIKQSLAQAAARGSAGDKDRIDRIRSFVKLSDEALGRGDFRQADALAERAQVLSRELQGGR